MSKKPIRTKRPKTSLNNLTAMSRWLDTSQSMPIRGFLTLDEVIDSFKSDYRKMYTIGLSEEKLAEIDAQVSELKAHHGKRFKCGGVARGMAWVKS